METLTVRSRYRRRWSDAWSALVGLALVVTATPALAQTAPRPDIRDVSDYERVQREAVAYLRSFRAADIERGLPSLPFGRWLDSVLGPGLEWEMNDCGEGPRAPGASLPVCVGIEREQPRVSLAIAIGNTERGVIGRPTLFYGQLRLWDVDRSFERLRDLSRLVTEADAKRAKSERLPR